MPVACSNSENCGPQGLKPEVISCVCGTTKVVPSPKSSVAWSFFTALVSHIRGVYRRCRPRGEVIPRETRVQY
jgi:hypothetical protein